MKQLYIAAQASWRLLRLYEDSVMPQTELATASSLASFETGSVDSTQVLMNLMTCIDQEERYHEELLNYFLSLIQLEEITGLELLKYASPHAVLRSCARSDACLRRWGRMAHLGGKP